MQKNNSILTNFSSGEVSPKLAARIDLAQYQNSCRTILNGIVTPQGGVEKRPGTYFVNEIKNSSQKAYLLPFKYSAADQYVLEVGDGYIRFYHNHALVTNAEIATPYTTTEIPEINIVQSADIVYFAHRNHPPSKLSRTATGFAYDVVTFQTGDIPVRNVGAGQAGCVRITATNHGLASNNAVYIDGVIGVTQANGIFTINVVDVNTFDLIGSSLPGAQITDCLSGSLNPGKITVAAPAFTFIAGQTVNIGGVEGTEEANGTWLISSIPDAGYGLLANSAYVNNYICGGWISQASDYAYVSGGGITLIHPISNAVDNGSGEVRITAKDHGLLTGQGLKVTGVLGTTEANGTWNITVIDKDTYDLDDSVFANTYIAGSTNDTYEAITNAIANPDGLIRLTVGYTQPCTTGQTITVIGITGTTEANGTWVIIVVDTTTIDLVGSTFSNAYIGGGIAHTAFYSGYGIPLTFATANNYPSMVTFFEQRLVWGSTLNQSQTLWLSHTGDFENFVNGPNDDDALNYTLNSDGVNTIRWIAPWNVLLLGTVDGEWRFGGSTITDPVTPSSALAKQQSNKGSANIKALLIGDLVVFIQFYGKKIYQIGYDFVRDSFTSAELTKLSSHITGSGITWMCNQDAPETIVFLGRSDGVIAHMTFYTDEKIIAFSRNVTQGLYESGTLIRGETEDEVWVIVNRNGRRYVEYFMSRDFKTGESGLRPYPYFFVDSGLTFDGGDPVKIIGVSKTNPVVISYSGIIDPTNGWTVRLESLSGMDEINDDVFTVAGVNAGANTFQLSGVDGTDFTDYVSGGTWERVVDNVTGIGHLSGCEVDVCADGNSIGPLNVSGATLNLGGYYNRVSAGLHYDYVVEPQPVEINTQFGTSVGITKRVEKLTAMLYETIGCKAGTSLNNVQDLIAPLNSELFTGDVPIEFPGDYDTKVLLTFLHDEPLPCTILGVITLMAAGER